MQQLSCRWSDIASLRVFIEQHQLTLKRGVIQVFSSVGEAPTQLVTLELAERLPHFCQIGVSSFGEVSLGSLTNNSIVLHFSIFEESTSVEVLHWATNPDSSSTEKPRFFDDTLSTTPKLAIIYSCASTKTNEEIIEAIQSQAPSCVVTGGITLKSGSFVVSADGTLIKGAVVALFSGEALEVVARFSGGWSPIGRSYTVTHATSGELFSLDNIPAMEVYRRYFGSAVFDHSAESLRAFPLCVKSKGQLLLRAPMGFNEDTQSISLAGSIAVGDEVTFAFFDSASMYPHSLDIHQQSNLTAMVHSCHFRQAVWGSQAIAELESLSSQLQASAALLTAQFISRNKQVELQNLTTTVVIAHEGEESLQALPQEAIIFEGSKSLLTQLVRAANKDLNRTLNFLAQHHDALDYSSIISMTDKHGVILSVNKKFEEISGYTAAELVGQTHRLVRHPKMPDKVFSSLWKTISKKKPWQGLIRNQRKSGESYYVKTIIVPVLDDLGEIQRYLSIRHDVTDIIHAKETIKRQTTDTLTGLPNLTKLIADSDKHQFPMLALFDARNFKSLNDFCGMDKGDLVIQSIATSLVTHLGMANFTCYKLNGATFAIAPVKPIPLDEFESQVKKIKNHLETTPVKVASRAYEITFCVGIGVSDTRALAFAESAIAEAKDRYFGVTMVTKLDNNEPDEAFFWVEEVRKALETQRVVPYFQCLSPIKSKPLHRKKYEALARVIMEDGTIASPGMFLRHIKKTRYYGLLTRSILVAALIKAEQEQCDVAINISIQDIIDDATVAFILEQLKIYGGEHIIFELTESEAIHDFTAMKEFIVSVRQFSASVAIDDFGSGYSNFANLVQIKPEFIKIDGSIIQAISHNTNSAKVAKSIIDMARSLEIQTIAEFVSDESIFNSISQLGVDFVQGYFVHQPSPLISLPEPLSHGGISAKEATDHESELG